MSFVPFFLRFVCMGFFFCSLHSVWAEELKVAVASNFSVTMIRLARTFQEETGHSIILINGSTGKHYTQIKNGAPFDLFFAADRHHPKLLEEAGLGIAGTRFTYAAGRLVLWSPKDDYIDPEGKRLAIGDFRHLAMANPQLAPYGKAAREVLEKRGLWHILEGRLVRGENIGQTFQFVKSGSAELGFIALSQIKSPGTEKIEGSYWVVPRSFYEPILQEVLLLKDSPAGRDFLRFIKGEEARKMIQSFGYDTP